MDNTLSPQQIGIELNPKQAEVDNSLSPEIFYISGVGGGKSFELGQWTLDKAKHPNSLGLLAAPTHDVMRQSTLPQVQESWAKAGIFENIHYVINIEPPEEWGVKPFSSLSNTRIITFAWQSYIVLDTLDNINKARGAEYDYIAVDEFRDISFSNVRKVLLARLRGKAFRTEGLPLQILWVSTPPDNPLELNDLLERNAGHIHVVEGTSYDNIMNLPEGYIEGLESKYDPLTTQREIYGKRIYLGNGKPFLYGFDIDRNASDKIGHKEGLAVYLSFDFNVDPATCLVWQEASIDGKPFIHYINEVFLENSNLYEVCERIDSLYPHSHFIVTGDATGRSRHHTQRGNFNSYTIIKQTLKLKDAQIQVGTSNPAQAEVRTLANAILCKYPEVLIHPQHCKHLIQDLLFTTAGDDGKKETGKDKHRGHLLDCFLYSLWTFHRSFIKKGT